MAETAYYSSTAWNPGRDEKPRRRGQLDTRSRNFRFQWAAGQKLPKSYVPDLVPSSFLRTWHAKDVDADVEMGVGNAQRLRNEGKCDKPVGWIDQESIRYATLPSSSWRWLIVKAFAKFLSTIGALVFTIICISMLITVEDDWRSLLQEFYIPVMFYGGGTSVLIWGIISLIERLFPRWIYKDPQGPLWEFNRRTGLVTAFRNPKKKRDAGQVAWQSPFSEFDGYVHSGPTHQGLPLYYGAMVHRYREEALTLTAFQAASANDEDHKALWNFWLQYMDSTAPLPDIPLFEPHRHKDPVTAEHDKATGRHSRYWRDMDEVTYKQKTDEIYKKCLKVFG
ncbi:hypothetical protein [Marinobacter salarius]|uniref:hypothetical protein n=1 Tax=Marinobacter salarius TaxID=1420917 RepID=UPI000F8585B4|nr:hypothetical protein [Marinobacter salarius]AZR41415.1 hypothetical protein MTMN5_01965 [Marinobacter salarius]